MTKNLFKLLGDVVEKDSYWKLSKALRPLQIDLWKCKFENYSWFHLFADQSGHFL